MEHTPVLIIGAGPAGLAIAGRLRKLDIPFEIIEKRERVGITWHEHYDRLHLHTTKELSNLPYLPFPEDHPTFVSKFQVADYLLDYAAHFDLKPHFNTSLKTIQPHEKGWEVQTEQGRTFLAEQVVLATGVNRVPNRPSFNGESRFKGQILHSRAYRTAKDFVGQKVLVIGMGNTGAELALDLYEQGAQPAISVRSPVNIVPLEVFGRPTQKTALLLAKLPNWLGDAVGRLVGKITVGDLSKYGLKTPAIPPSRQLREYGRTPVIDLGTVKEIKAGNIKVLGAIDRFDEEGVYFKSGHFEPFDTVVLATGYKAMVTDFLWQTDGLLDRFDLPKHIVGAGKYEGLYFLGFDNYTSGGILGNIFRDSEAIANWIKKGVTS